MQKITPFLWFDNQAEEAANFYVSIFENSKVGDITHYGEAAAEISGKPKGSVLTVTFQIEGQEFTALNGGPVFKFTPAVSFLVACKTKEEVDALWKELSENGTALMELGEYPFSEKYGWVQDRYGLSWQVMFMGDGTIKQKITPTLMFVGDVCGKAEEAINFYASVFDNAKVGDILRYREGEEPDNEGTIKHAAFTLEGQEFAAMDSAHKHNFTFNEAISLMVHCETQQEVDELWEKFSHGGEIQQCGWLKDKYGVSWQIIPTVLFELMNDPDPAKSGRVMQAMLQMTKIEINALKQAYEQQ
jgi:predicted 3-demethylubiquinone-9 3-methyltransferase (glyoxalase superfamily)